MVVILADPLVVSWPNANKTSLLSTSVILESVCSCKLELEMNKLDTVQQGRLLLLEIQYFHAPMEPEVVLYRGANQ